MIIRKKKDRQELLTSMWHHEQKSLMMRICRDFFSGMKTAGQELAMEMGMHGFATGKEKRGFPEQYLRQNTKQSLNPQGEKN